MHAGSLTSGFWISGLLVTFLSSLLDSECPGAAPLPACSFHPLPVRIVG